MNLRKLAFACAAALCVTCSWLNAAAESELFAGATVPVGDFSYARKMGLFVGGDYARAIAPFVDAGVMGAYHRLSPPALRTGHAHLFEALAFGRIHAPLGLYLLGGAGVAYSTLDLAGEGGGSAGLTVAGGGGCSFLGLRLMALVHRTATTGDPRSYVTVAVASSF